MLQDIEQNWTEYDRFHKIGLTHKASKENLSNVYNDHTADEKTSNEYSDDELINFNYVSTATNPANICWSWRRLEDVSKTCLEDVFNTSSA